MKRKPMTGMVLTAPDGTDLRDSLTRKREPATRQRPLACWTTSASGRAGRRFAFLNRTLFAGVPIPPLDLEVGT